MGKVVKIAVGVGLFFIPGLGPTAALIAKSIGANLLLGEAARMLGPRPPKQRINPQIVSMRGNTLPGSIVYGEPRTAGMIYIPTPGVSGQGNKYLHYIVVLAVHECEVSDLWFDNVHIPSEYIDVDGNVTSDKYQDKALIEKYLGTDDQTASAMLVDAVPLWTTDHRGRGICYLHVRMERDDEAFPQGPPQNFFALVKGRRVYDPRTGATAWSDNPALCLRDYLVTYCNATVDETLVAAAANICDETVTVPSGTQKRYRCAGVLSTGEEPADNITSLLSAMSGTLTFAGGKFRMFAGAYDAPTQTIGESWLAGSVALQITTPGDKLYNVVRAQYVDPERNHQLVESEVQASAGFQSIDGRELERSLALPFTFSEYQAQRQTFLSLNMSRGQRVLEVLLNMRALNLRVWDTVNVVLPRMGISEVYRVMSWRYADNASVAVVLREESAGFYQPPANYISATSLADAETLPESPNAPNNLTITPGSGGNQLTWTNPPSRQFDQIEIWRSPDADFANAVLIATVRASAYFDIVTAADTPFYWIRARNSSGQFSDYIPEITESGSGGGTVPPPPEVSTDLSATLSPISLNRTVENGTTGTTAFVTCTASAGTGPYTYIWTRVSGSVDITATADTSASTAFTAAAAFNTTKTSTWKCTVTDSASLADVADSQNVGVSISWQDNDSLIGI